MIEELVPAAVAAVERFDDELSMPLFAEEEAHVARAVPKRRHEFTTARWCARQAMARLGLPPSPIMPGTAGAPGWPTGVVGSMTHCHGYRAAALAHARDIAAIGIDAEPNEALPDGVLTAIASPVEQDRLRRLADIDADVCWPRLLFCAKEALYKVWYPLTARWLDFHSADVVLGADGRFTARVLVPGIEAGPQGGPMDTFTGQWTAGHGLLLTSLVLPTPSPAA